MGLFDDKETKEAKRQEKEAKRIEKENEERELVMRLSKFGLLGLSRIGENDVKSFENIDYANPGSGSGNDALRNLLAAIYEQNWIMIRQLDIISEKLGDLNDGH